MKTKDRVLAFLEKHRGNYISGVAIAESLEVTRNTVWKAIKQLEAEGYDIEAVTNKGYRLSESSYQLSEVGIRETLPDTYNEKAIYYFDKIDSTNKKAKELAVEGAEHGTLVVANEQFAGKGRYGRNFESPKDTGIYMSIILKPKELSYRHPTTLTAYAGVVVSEVVKELTGKELGIKWVNDLYLSGKKVCGILTEAVTDFESGEMEWIVLGIGLNVSTAKESFSEEVKHRAGQIYQASEDKVNRNKLVGSIYQGILEAHLSLSEGEMMKRYREKSIVIGETVVVQRGNEESIVTIETIDDEGQLVIRNKQGNVETYNSGEIRVILNN